MLKWIIFASIGLVAVVFVIRVIRTMLKIEKQSNKEDKAEPVAEQEYTPTDTAVDMRSSAANIVTDMSTNTATDDSVYNFDSQTGFTDHADDEFFDYSAHMHNRKGRRRQSTPDFDLDGEFADDFEYQPRNFDYLANRRPPKKKKSVSTELNELPTELKVLMLSDIFDRKFFD